MGTSMDNMVHHLEKQVKTSPVVDMKPVFQSLTLDVIAKVAFGLESNTHETPNSELFAQAKKIAGETQVQDTMTAIMVNLVSVFTGTFLKSCFLAHWITLLDGRSPEIF